MPDFCDLVRMSDREAEDYIRRQRDLHVSTLNRDGSVHMTTNWFGLDQGRIVFAGYEASQKMVNLRRDPRVTVLASSGGHDRERAGVAIRGRVRFADDRCENLRLLGLISQRVRAMAGEPRPSAKPHEEMIVKRICVIIEPEYMIGWDHAKLDPADPPGA